MQNDDYPSILKLKELEAITNMLTTSYGDAQAAYEQAISMKDTKDAKRWLGIMDKINADLNAITSSAGDVIRKVERSGVSYQDIATLDSRKLHLLSRQLDVKSKQVARMRANLTDVDGEMQTSGQEQSGNFLQMTVLSISAIVIALLIGKAAMSSEISPAENVILIAAIAALLYHLVSSLA